jgi:hypothetical protein
MAWRTATLQDIASTLNQRELDMFRAHPDFKSDIDPVIVLLRQVASYVRGVCRRNKTVKMSPEEYSIPESLMGAAMDFAAWKVLKRLPIEVGEDRKKAAEDAKELFKEVAAGEYTPESWYATPEEGSDTDSNLAKPKFSDNARYKILNSYPQI